MFFKQQPTQLYFLLYFCSCLFVTFNIHAQEGYYRDIEGSFDIDLGVGVSIPFSDVAATQGSATSSGYATSGFAAAMRGSYQQNSRFKAIGTFIFSGLPYDLKAISKNQSQLRQGTVQADARLWQIQSLQIGSGYTWLNKEKLTAYLYGQLGILFIYKPQVNYRLSQNGNTLRYVDAHAQDNGLVFSGGNRIRYAMNEKLFLALTIEYQNSSADLNYNTTSNGQLEPVQSSLDIQLIQAWISIGIKI